MRLGSAWDELGQAGQRAVELAWRGFGRSGRGIGAVLTDEKGKIQGEGRTRISDRDAPNGHLFGSWIAHAEIDVLGRLPPGGYRGWTLTTTLEPCVLCASAIAMSNIDHVRFLAGDPLSRGVERLPEIVPWLAKDWPSSDGPEKSAIAAFCALLALFPALRDKPRGVLVSSYENLHPGLCRLGRDLIAKGWQPGPDAALLAELEKLWPALSRVNCS